MEERRGARGKDAEESKSSLDAMISDTIVVFGGTLPLAPLGLYSDLKE